MCVHVRACVCETCSSSTQLYCRGFDVVGGFSSFAAVTAEEGGGLPNNELHIILQKQLTFSDSRISISLYKIGHNKLLLTFGQYSLRCHETESSVLSGSEKDLFVGFLMSSFSFIGEKHVRGFWTSDGFKWYQQRNFFFFFLIIILLKFYKHYSKLCLSHVQ